VGTDLAAFRILQESLTNVIRHAGATMVNVAVRYAPHELSLEVIDDGTGSPNGHGRGAGSGIAGMRERANALGGELSAGRCLGGGFRVCARLPVGGDAG
jgi:signal transduction histidine kinase